MEIGTRRITDWDTHNQLLKNVYYT